MPIGRSRAATPPSRSAMSRSATRRRRPGASASARATAPPAASPPSRWSPTAGSTRSTPRRGCARSTPRPARSIWEHQVRGENSPNETLYGGGVSYDGGRLYVTNGAGDAAALDAATGNQIWMVKPGGPLRGAPTIGNDNVYVLSQDSQLYALNAANGETRWTRRRLVRARRRVRRRRAGLRAIDARRRLRLGRAHRLSLRERPGGLAGRAGADRHLHRRRHALRHRRRSGDRQWPRLRDRPGRAHGRGRADHRPARLGAERRRHLDPLGGGRMGVRGHRPGAIARGRRAARARSAGSRSFPRSVIPRRSGRRYVWNPQDDAGPRSDFLARADPRRQPPDSAQLHRRKSPMFRPATARSRQRSRPTRPSRCRRSSPTTCSTSSTTRAG